MPGTKATGKPSDKLARQLLFSEALQLNNTCILARAAPKCDRPGASNNNGLHTTGDHSGQPQTQRRYRHFLFLPLRPPKTDRNRLRPANGVPEGTSAGPKERKRNLQTSPDHRLSLETWSRVRQLLSAARAHGPFKTDGYEIHITADYSRETNERRKGFLALRPRMRQLEVKYGLFEPARLWVTKNGVSKDFYDPKDLRIFLDSLQPQSMDTTNPDRPLRPPSDNRSTSPPTTDQEGPDQFESDHRLRGSYFGSPKGVVNKRRKEIAGGRSRGHVQLIR
ncbi:hypothetical protein NDU88_012584 [Pleurodeles waltl]|uniref:Uncharacterized protein n=1 Tax=Pleurodeles waltl TaxID=8319 RepID=A0AAV7R0K0_PLEWA|nr:hypothetical protein NDU88_012584 [Pleurodeles waltl]